MTRTIIGIDPGTSGGIAVHDGNGIVTAYPMPKTERDLFDLMFELSMTKNPTAVIERVHSMPGNGAKAMFTFGMNYGQLRMVLIAHQIPFVETLPTRWMKYYSMKRDKKESKTDWKNRLKSAAQQRFPNIKMTHAIADACLIANYGNTI